MLIAREHARQAAVSVDFRQGDVARMPFAANSCDLVVCQAAFKNFAEPVKALDEMHRVLREGGSAVIQDMRRDASDADIDHELQRMELRGLSAVMTRWTLRALRLRAYSVPRFERLAAASAFGTCNITVDGIGIEIRLTKLAAGAGGLTDSR